MCEQLDIDLRLEDAEWLAPLREQPEPGLAEWLATQAIRSNDENVHDVINITAEGLVDSFLPGVALTGGDCVHLYKLYIDFLTRYEDGANALVHEWNENEHEFVEAQREGLRG